MPTALTEELRDSLTQLRSAYEALHLSAALNGARRLRAKIDATTEVVPPELHLEVYQYLAMLHSDRGLYQDSIAYYTEAAEQWLEPSVASHLRARHQLCLALSRYHDWRWVEMDLACALGLRLLKDHREHYSSLYARLQLTQGIARKMYAYSILDASLQREQLYEAVDLLRSAVDGYRLRSLPRLVLAYEDLGILYSRLPAEEWRVPGLVDSIAGVPGVDRVVVDSHRLLGYYHRRAGRMDSSRYHYQQLLARERIFRYDYVSEAQFALREAQREAQDYAAALATNAHVLVQTGCCPPGAGVDRPDRLAACTLRTGCIYDLTAQADTYLQRYQNHGDTLDLELAHRFATTAVDHYDGALRSLTEEAAYHRLIVLGDRLVTVALEITYAKLEATAEKKYLNTLFRIMEFGNSYLLNKELMTLSQSASTPALLPLSDSLTAINRELSILKHHYTARKSMDLARLQRTAALIHAGDSLAQRLQPRFENAFAERPDAGGTVGVRQVQAGLSPRQALLTFAEAGDRLLVIYIDRDTCVHYAVDADIFSRTRRIEAAIVKMQTLSDTLRQALGSVARQLLGPVAAEVAGRRELLLIPSASLSSFPFAALPEPAVDTVHASSAAPYLVERHSLRYLDSWRSDRWNQARRAQSLDDGLPRVGVWTHPQLGGYLGALGDRLVARGKAGSAHYTGPRCHSQGLLSRGGGYDWLHLSVHARGNTVRLNDNYLYLNRRDSLNGLHFASRRMNTRLVVLAACSTARGVSTRREGTYSIRRSFHRAGVPDVVASLYDIPAAATAGILEEFYRGLWRGLPPERALAEAQRACLSGRLDRRWVVPGFWAGLVVG